MNMDATITKALARQNSLPSRAQRGICFFLFLCAFIATTTDAQAKRPKISGIASVSILTSDLPEARTAYQTMLGPDRNCVLCEQIPVPQFALASGQLISLASMPSPAPANLLSQIVFATEDIKKMKQFFGSQKIVFQQEPQKGEASELFVNDPDGHSIAFVHASHLPGVALPGKPPFRLIHAGFMVRDRAAMDHFYKDILGFRPYWHGGMKDDETSWVSLQVPDGTDWIEFMLNVPENSDQRLRGIMNHIALGVPDIHAAQKQLLTNGMKLTEEPKVGRDGKWQLNVYDPDQTRIEFMEFTPVEKPCCSEYTGPHPKP